MQTIDCDVHVAPETFDALFPYLNDYWRQYITEAGVRLNGVAFAYPPNAPTTASPIAREQAGPAVPATYNQLKENVLDRTDPRAVVLNCLTGFETHRNPYYAAASRQRHQRLVTRRVPGAGRPPAGGAWSSPPCHLTTRRRR